MASADDAPPKAGPRAPRLVAGVDYYLEKGNLVFTANYHLKRGFCCNSGCRHCPYKEGGMPKVDVEIVGVEPKPPR